MPPVDRKGMRTPQLMAEKAVSVVGFGYDLSKDIRLSSCKPGPSGSRLIELDEGFSGDLVVPGGVVIPNVSKCIKCDKGERTRFRSDVLAFHQMSEHFNQELSLSGKVPSGLFNAMFDFRGCWQKDASSAKNLAFDGWYITLYNIELARSHIVLHDVVKQDVPPSWDPAALSEFIEKYGTHVITGVKMGAKDVIHIKQLLGSLLQPTEVQNLLKNLADDSFSENFSDSFSLDPDELSRKLEDKHLSAGKPARSSLVSHSKNNDIISIHVRRGGIDCNQSHNQWLSTVSHSPDAISMSLVPITSLLYGVRGSGFLSHAVNLYLRYKPPIEELHQFLEFQLPRQWAPVFSELSLGPRNRKHAFPSLQFTIMGPKLHINNIQVDSGNRPVTGIRLYLEGKKSNCLAVHLQHLSSLPASLQLTEDTSSDPDDGANKAYYEALKWPLLSHVCTAPVQYNGARIDDSASIVTKAWLEVKELGMKKVLFLRLGFSTVASSKIRRSEWDSPTSISRKSGLISSLISTRFSTIQAPPPMPAKVDTNSAVCPHGPPIPVRVPKMSKFIDTTEMMRGAEDPPGYWVVTGAKLCVEGGKISLKVKYSLLIVITEDEI